MITQLKKSFFLATFLVFASTAYAVTPTARPSQRPSASVKNNSCSAREAAVKTQMASLVRFSNNMLEKFSAIALRVENFYTNTVLPSGKTVPDYDKLVADIAAKKAAVSPLLDKAQTDVNAFSCENGDPKTLFTTFRQDMQAVKRALHEYRTSIKNLIVAVKRVAGEGEEVSPTPSPSPTAQPERNI